ncbi:interferon gamma receptor 1-like isoform X2 [Anguilla anguilla]|uniref:interferon gamma receptor 1-like isoform X2 n=1 Tax=Anguilla anguilla TaxID=7936 RepID=UPI0015B1AD91|nr:interferon gamma receptor 1-like isoform X2 [Anguilla anguilla]
MYSVAPTVFMLLQLFLDKGFSYVPPPDNVTIQCHNFRTVAYWNYSQPSLHPRFIVDLFPYGGREKNSRYLKPDSISESDSVTSCFNITHRHCNVSKLVLRSVRHGFYLNVTAVVGLNRSEPTASAEFTYNSNEFQDELCFLDFPPVNLSESDGMLKFEFPHPFDFYSEALRHVNDRKYYKSFTYEVLGQEKMRLDCERKKKGLCEGLVSAPGAQEKPCIRLKGTMNNIHIATAEEVCLQELNQTALTIQPPKAYSADNWSLILALAGAGAAVVVFTVCAGLVFRRKTKGSTAFPKIMASMLANPHSARRLLQPETDATSEVLSVAPRSDSEQESPDGQVPTGTLIPEEGSRFPIGTVIGRGGSFSEGQTYDGLGGSEQGSRSEEEEQENSACRGVESSGYDRPHVSLTFEISPGDRVQGYKLTQA